jgi:methionine-gamma-lyase
VYGNTYALLDKGVTRFGIDTKFVDFTNLDEVAAAIGPKTKLVYFETPANPNLRIVDIAGVVALAHAKGVMVVVDNTFATPILQRPLDLGADLVIHSATKFLGGHGDLLAGVVAGKAETIKTIRMNGLRFLTGATISPFAAFLMLRGLKTLEIRVERHSKSAATIAERLAKHGAIETLHYPGLPDHPRAAIVKRQMASGGGLIAFELKGGIKAGVTVMEGMYYNDWFPGHQIGMAPPLSADRVEYADGTKATLEQHAHDVSVFLAWASSPHLEARNSLGMKVILFLLILAGLLYATKRKIWRDIKH